MKKGIGKSKSIFKYLVVTTIERHKIYRTVFYVMLLLIISVGFYQGVLADTGSKDSQWYPVTLLAQDIEFYSYYLEHSQDWFMRSVPNYYFQFYYILLPVSTLSWDTFKLIWFGLNAVMLLFFLTQLRKEFKFEYREMTLILLPFLIGFPLINVFTNGQSTIIIVVLAYLAWIYRENKILLPILLSLLTMKYSFGIPILFGFLLMGYYRSVVLGSLLTLFFPLLYSIKFDLNFIASIFLPLKVSSSDTTRAIGSGSSDIMSLYAIHFEGPLMGLNILTVGLLVLMAIFSYLVLRYKLDKKTIFLCSLVFSLFGFYHLGYDHVMFLLILPFVFRMKSFKVLYGYLLLFCFAPRMVRIIDLLLHTDIGVKEFMRNQYFVIFNICCLITIFYLIIRNDVNLKKNVRQEAISN